MPSQPVEIWCNQIIHLFFLKKRFIYRQMGREGEREGEKHQCVVASLAPPTGDLAHNSGMCPDWELNWPPLGSQPVLNPLSHTSQGQSIPLFITFHRTRARGCALGILKLFPFFWSILGAYKSSHFFFWIDNIWSNRTWMRECYQTAAGVLLPTATL